MSELNDFKSFLTAEDNFKIEMEKYIPEFIERMKNDTMYDKEFVERTLELKELGKSAGIDMQQYIIDYSKANGIE